MVFVKNHKMASRDRGGDLIIIIVIVVYNNARIVYFVEIT